MQIKELLIKLITHNNANGIVDESIIEKMDLYLLVGRITQDEYIELYEMMYPSKEETVDEDMTVDIENIPTIIPEIEE